MNWDVLIISHTVFAIQYASKIGFWGSDPLVKSSRERSGIYSQYLFWCNLGTPDVEKKNFIWSSKLTHLSINFMSFCLIRGSQDTASEGFAYQPTSFQLCILYICICACVCMCVCWHFNARKIHLLQDVMYILNGRSVLIFSYFWWKAQPTQSVIKSLKKIANKDMKTYCNTG